MAITRVYIPTKRIWGLMKWAAYTKFTKATVSLCMIKEFLHLEKMPKLDDTTDALAIAICHTHHQRFESFAKVK